MDLSLSHFGVQETKGGQFASTGGPYFVDFAFVPKRPQGIPQASYRGKSTAFTFADWHAGMLPLAFDKLLNKVWSETFAKITRRSFPFPVIDQSPVAFCMWQANTWFGGGEL